MSKTIAQRPRLGRGLSSLINMSDLPVEAQAAPPQPSVASGAPQLTEPITGAAVIDVPIDDIAPNPSQPRRTMNQNALAELAASIRATGVIQPVLVKRLADGKYQLIAGERRWRASRLAEMKTIAAIVREVDTFTQAQMALIENIQREDLNPIDRAAGYRTLIDQLGLTQNELAGRLGEDRAVISHYIRLLDLAASVQELIKDGKISFGHAKLLAGVPDSNEQMRLAKLCATQNLAIKNLERIILGSASKGPKKDKVAAGNPMHLADLEKRVSAQLGMRVNVRTRPKTTSKGRVVIHYANLDQFDELMTKLGVKLDD